MGCIYRLKNSPFWWLKYTGTNGIPQYESSKTRDYAVAKDLLAIREGKIAVGVPVTAAAGRLTFKEAAADLVNDYKVNQRPTLNVLENRLRLHLMPYFGRCRMAEIDTTMIRAYIVKRQADRRIKRQARTVGRGKDRVHVPAVTEAYAAASINRELEILQRCFTLAVEAQRLLHTPHVPMLDENNVRKGFLVTPQIVDVCGFLPSYLQPVVRFAYLTGWRTLSEVLPLEWPQVDFEAGEIRLYVGETKNGEGRLFAMNDDLRTLLLDQRRITDELQRERRTIIPYVFHRNGAQIKSFYKAWHSACRKAGVPGKLPHDMCRSSARNMIRRGVPQKVAQELMGRKTGAIFDRYHIIDSRDLHEGAERLNGLAGSAEVKQEVKQAAVISARPRRVR
jgi:integrase